MKNYRYTLILWKNTFYATTNLLVVIINVHLYDFYNATDIPRIVQCTTQMAVGNDVDEVGCWWTLRYTDGSFGVRPGVAEQFDL